MVLGADGLLVRRAIDALTDAVLPSVGPPAFNVATYRAGDEGADEALGTARTLPMMADRRLVVVKDLHEGSNAFFAALESYLEAPSDTTTLLLSGAGFPKVVKGGRNWGARIPKRVAKVGEALSFGARDADPVAFVVAHAASLGHAVDRTDARLLVELVGQDLSTLAREVEKATLYVDPGQALDATAIAAACSALAEKEAWDLSTGIAAREPERALGALHRLLAQGESPHRLLGLIAWQLRIVLRAGELQRRGASPDEITRTLRLRRDTARAIRAALRGRNRGAAEVLQRVARANRQMNRAKSGDARVLEALVVDLASP